MSIKSMTGFGHGEGELKGKKAIVDIKSLNGRFLDINVKASKQLLPLEERVKQIVSNKLARGNVDVFINFEDSSEQSKLVKVDVGLVNGYMLASEQLAGMTGLENNMTVSSLYSLEDVVKIEKPEIDIDEAGFVLEQAMFVALANLEKMREKEGDHIKTSIKDTIININTDIQKIKYNTDKMKDDIFKKIKTRVSDILNVVPVDETRLLNEAAYYIDKLDINEEICRIEAHLEHIGTLLNQKEPVGKRIEFLAQELTREVNTIGAKSTNVAIIALSLDMKNEVEKLKENIRNVE